MSAMHNPPTPAADSSEPLQLLTHFPVSANGAASTSASMISPTTPFSQSALPSKSLLSRQDSSAFESSLPDGGAVGGQNSQVSLPRSVQKNLQTIIKRVFESCYQVGAYRQVVGIAIEARNLEVLREAILRASKDDKNSGKRPAPGSQGKGEELMEYVLDICMNVVQEISLRNEVSPP